MTIHPLDRVRPGADAPTQDEAVRLRDRVVEHDKALRTKIAKIDSELDEFRSKARDELMPQGRQLSTEARRNLEAVVDKQVHERSRELREKSQNDRDRLLKFINEHGEAVAAFETLYPTPIALLASQGLGTEQRSRFVEQLQHSGPAELLNFANRAIARRDPVLGAAVLSRLDALSKESRPFTAGDLAKRLVGVAHAERIHLAREAKHAFQSARNANHSFEMSRQPSSNSKILAGLRSRALNPETGTHEKIGRAMRGTGG